MLSFAFTCAPFLSSIFAVAAPSANAAPCSGVQPLLSFAFTCAPFSSSIFAVAAASTPAALCRGVRPLLSFAFTCAPFSSSIFAVAVASALAASCRGVRLLLFLAMSKDRPPTKTAATPKATASCLDRGFLGGSSGASGSTLFIGFPCQTPWEIEPFTCAHRTGAIPPLPQRHS